MLNKKMKIYEAPFMYFPISFTFERKKKKKSDIALKNNKDTNDLFLMHILLNEKNLMRQN
ncbi:hypothetical protein PFTANZ_02594 [Plasmodium falciparum Tanzania (2000708)]|uniref:Uncharacterized protein n=1 Tax=Plasmodium falciparum Tanzania (2000708) TaxID=1036725 RepID=A0A024W8X2_PLAFA|nr:hypothetical protein PFTANZ_02594 [Plasmodium falciparum Tanzania (2000708)]